jgi:hypothetical protein
MPSLRKRTPILGTQTVTVVTTTSEGGGPGTSTFTFTYDSLGPGAFPTVIINGGGPGDN